MLESGQASSINPTIQNTHQGKLTPQTQFFGNVEAIFLGSRHKFEVCPIDQHSVK
jgi:hypothetical protein